jgi:molybdopterin synthase sulfur carrier subunit
MPAGTLRFWAAARAAAGVAEEPYDATTLAEALARARAVHGDALGRVLDRCSYVVDDAPVGGRAHDTVMLTEGGSVEVLPPFAGGSSDAGPSFDTESSTADATESAMLRDNLFGVGAGLVAAALAGLALIAIGPLVAGIFAVQAFLALAWLAALDVPGGGGAFVICLITAGTIDGVIGTESEPDIGKAAGIVGVAVVLSLLYQLARKPRVEVTASFAGTLAGLVFVLSAATYPALRIEVDGDVAVAAALLGVAAALVAGRLVDIVLPRPAVMPRSRRGVVGVLAGLTASVLVGWAYGAGQDALGTEVAIRLAAVTALIAVVVDLAVDAVVSAAPPAEARARSALAPLGTLLPVVLAGPAAYVAGRILLG